MPPRPSSDTSLYRPAMIAPGANGSEDGVVTPRPDAGRVAARVAAIVRSLKLSLPGGFDTRAIVNRPPASGV